MRLSCSVLEKNDPYPKISILQVMKILCDSWEAVTKEALHKKWSFPLRISSVFMNCFKKPGTNSDVQQAAIVDSDDQYKDLEEN